MLESFIPLAWSYASDYAYNARRSREELERHNREQERQAREQERHNREMERIALMTPEEKAAYLKEKEIEEAEEQRNLYKMMKIYYGK